MAETKKIKSHAHFGVGAIFWVEKYKADGTITQKLGPFHNTVLDTGLDGLAETSIYTMTARCHVGTGNTAPTTSDTALDSHLTSTTSLYGSATTANSTAGSVPYASITRTFNFSIGSVTGNLAEVGLSKNDGATYTYFNRQLFLDEIDTPTTITVLADEGLRVTAEARIYGDLEYNVGTDTGSFTFDNDGSNEDNGWTRYCFGFGWASSDLASNTYDSGLGCINARLSNHSSNQLSGSSQGWEKSDNISHAAYTGGTYTRSTTLTWNAGTLNSTFQRMYIGPYCTANDSPACVHALVFDDPIAIASTETAEFTISVSWGRYTP